MAPAADAVHDTEVFGPAATIIPYKTESEAFALVARGGGSLVASVYGDDRAFFARAVAELGPSHGRLLMVEPSIADAHTGHGIVMPQCHHGGPGRAGNGEELGGLTWSAALSPAARGAGLERSVDRIAGQGIRAALKEERTLSPFVPAQAGTRAAKHWIPACAGMNGSTAKTAQEETEQEEAETGRRERLCPSHSWSVGRITRPRISSTPMSRAGSPQSSPFIDPQRTHHLWRTAAADLPLRLGPAGARPQAGGSRRAAAARQRRLSGRVLGRDPCRHCGDPAQYLAQARAICDSCWPTAGSAP